MVLAARLLILCALILTGCRTAKTAAVKTFRVIDAPARYVRDRIDPEEQTTTTTTRETTYGNSDVVTPGRPINPSVPPPAPARSATAPQRAVTEHRASPSPRPNAQTSRSETAASTPRPSPAAPKPTAAAPSSDFPTARAVPGKPGFVYSTDSKGGMIDVTGYKSGDKAKDPYTHQVFIVP